jgi:hypothetical protein
VLPQSEEVRLACQSSLIFMLAHNRVITDTRLNINKIDRIHIPPWYTFFSGSPPTKNSGVKCTWFRENSGWAINREVFPGAHK